MDTTYSQALEGLDNDESLRKIEQEALQLLSVNPDFRRIAEQLVQNSNALREHATTNMFTAQLKQELENRLMAEASVRLFQVLTSPDAGIAPQIAALLQKRLTEAVQLPKK